MGPERIVCLTEETTEWLYLLGESERIVGISAYTVRPPEARKEKPRVSAFISGNITKIVKLKPDLVIGFSDIQADLARELIKAGLNVYIWNGRSLADILKFLEFVGNLVGKGALSRKCLTDWRKQLSKLKSEYSKKPRIRIFFQEWHEPMIGAISWVRQLLDIFNMEDVLWSPHDCWPQAENHSRLPMASDRILAAERVMAHQPSAIIGSWCGKKMDKKWYTGHPVLGELACVREKRIFEVGSDIILQPGPALFLEGIHALASIRKEIEVG